MTTENTTSPMKRFLPLIIFALLVVILAIGLTLNPRLVPSPLIGKPVPDFELPLLIRDGSFNSEQLKGQITLLNVWASWCLACQQEHDIVTELARSGLPIVGFNYKDEPDDAIAWLQRFGNPYRVIVKDIDGRVGIDWGVYGAPETFVIDQQGIIRHKVIGPLNAEIVRDELVPLIQELQANS